MFKSSSPDCVPAAVFTTVWKQYENSAVLGLSSGKGWGMVRWASGECKVNIKSQPEIDIGGLETCLYL